MKFELADCSQIDWGIMKLENLMLLVLDNIWMFYGGVSVITAFYFPSLWKDLQCSLKREKGFPLFFHLQCILMYWPYMLFIYWQTESAGIQRAQIQKELWRIQDVMEGLLKHKQQRSSSEAGKPMVLSHRKWNWIIQIFKVQAPLLLLNVWKNGTMTEKRTKQILL